MIPIAGDVGEENLGLSSADRLTLVEDVNIVFHSAATLDFEADLKSNTNINLLGTRRVVQLCQEIRDLKVNSICYLIILSTTSTTLVVSSNTFYYYYFLVVLSDNYIS